MISLLRIGKGSLNRLIFNKKHFEFIILHVPLLFDLIADNFLVTPEVVYDHRGQASTPEPEPETEPALDPYRASSYQWDPEEIANQWQPRLLLSTTPTTTLDIRQASRGSRPT